MITAVIEFQNRCFRVVTKQARRVLIYFMSEAGEQEFSKTLVLNSSYQPITTIDPKRAAVLMLSGIAELVEGTGGFYRSPSVSVPVASVVRLCRQTRTPRRYRVHLTRRALFARDAGKCAYCLAPAENIDHVIPKSRPGGTHTWSNVVASCQRCNVRKGARTPEEAGMKLQKTPTEPRGQEAFVLGLSGFQESWRMWLEPQRGL